MFIDILLIIFWVFEPDINPNPYFKKFKMIPSWFFNIFSTCFQQSGIFLNIAEIVV